jgi:hypothetical protein
MVKEEGREKGEIMRMRRENEGEKDVSEKRMKENERK